MYPSSSSSSSSSSSMNTSTTSTGPGGGLTRYGSAPSSLLTSVAESVTRDFSSLGPSRFFHPEPNNNNSDGAKNDGVSRREDQHGKAPFDLLHRSSYGGFANGGGASNSSASLVRQSSSPAGFLNHLASTVAGDNGFSITRGIGSYNSEGIADHNSRGITRLNSQLSFTRQETLSRISEEAQNNAAVVGTDNVQRRPNQSYSANAGFALGSWDDTNTTMFTVGSSKRAKNIVNDLDAMESEFQFGMPQAELEMATMENLLHIPQDSVPCKIRAKRGCATHPRSIAERERRTRISGKLKKLQDLVPNMDKQTSYADMLDLAVQHIRCLQNQVQKLNDDLESCTCGCKKSNIDDS